MEPTRVIDIRQGLTTEGIAALRIAEQLWFAVKDASTVVMGCLAAPLEERPAEMTALVLGLQSAPDSSSAQRVLQARTSTDPTLWSDLVGLLQEGDQVEVSWAPRSLNLTVQQSRGLTLSFELVEGKHGNVTALVYVTLSDLSGSGSNVEEAMRRQ
jgi:hypothetical protein